MKDLTKELAGTGPFLPGTLVTLQRPLKEKGSTRRKDAGVFHMLSYNVKGKNSSLYVKKQDYALAAEMVANYAKVRELVFDIGLETVGACRQDGFEAVAKAWQARRERQAAKVPGSGKQDGSAQRLRVLGQSQARWKAKAGERKAELDKNRVKLRDLGASREKWRLEALALRKSVEAEQKKVRTLEKDLVAVKKNGNPPPPPPSPLQSSIPPGTPTRC